MVFSDSNSGGVTSFSESIDSFAGDYFRDSAEHNEGIAVIFAIEDLAEDIELGFWGIESDRDIVDISPGVDEVFEGILIEVEAFDAHISASTFENGVIGDYTLNGIASGGMWRISRECFWKRSAFGSGGAAGLKVIFL